MRVPGFEPGFSRPQRDVLTSILYTLAIERSALLCLLECLYFNVPASAYRKFTTTCSNFLLHCLACACSPGQ